MWSNVLVKTLETVDRKLSGLELQFTLNLPTVGLIGYIGWITTDAFLREQYFTGDFFLHAFLTIGLILFICFFVYQVVVRVAASTDRLTGRAFESVKTQVEAEGTMPMNPVGEQVEGVLGLSALPVEEKKELAPLDT